MQLNHAVALTLQLAKHFRDVHFGGNWTTVNLRDTLYDINLEEATTKVADLNTIAVLVFHINYYVGTILKVLQGGELEGHDKYSFDLPALNSEEEWQTLITKVLDEAELLAAEIGKLEEAQLFEPFTDPKYGNYLRNIMGVTEHTHYHLGQITVIRKMIVAKEKGQL